MERTKIALKPAASKRAGPIIVNVFNLVKSLNMVMVPFTKQALIIITIDLAVPPEFLSDDMKFV